MNRDTFYTVPEAAKVLGISQTRVRQLLRESAIEGERTDTTWNVSKQSLHSFRDSYEPKGKQKETKQEFLEVREVMDKFESLQRELGRTEGRLELEEVARSTLAESLKREKARADAERQERIEAQKKIDALRNELEQAQLSWWKKLFR
jgi:excisionase family DNA binding protein